MPMAARGFCRFWSFGRGQLCYEKGACAGECACVTIMEREEGDFEWDFG